MYMYTQTNTRNAIPMQDNQPSNVELSDSNPSVDKVDVAIKQLKIQDSSKQDGDAMSNLSPYPDRPGEPDCQYYLRTGVCGFGINCKFNHPPYAPQAGHYSYELPQRVGQPDCEYFLKTGTCKYESMCKYHHPWDRHGAGPVLLNLFGLPIRQEEKPCSYYMRTGLCKFGASCKFNHPQPASVGPTAFAFMVSETTPPSGSPYVGGLGTWSLSRGAYMSSPSLQGVQTYMPIVFPSFQGWNTYTGSTNPTPTSVLGEPGSDGHVHLLSPPVSNLPERPGQPDCRYFLNNGNCKYGPDCKFHHPREKIAQFAMNPLGPLGFPSRPGQAVCSYYSLYGLCKYGPTCKYDHPFEGIVCNYDFGLPTASTADSPFFPFQKVRPQARSFETASSKSKLQDKIQKPEAVSDKSQNLDAKSVKDSNEAANNKKQS